MSLSTRRYDLLKSRIDGFTRMLPGVEAGDVRAIHRARVASRRLRELLPMLQLDHETTRKLERGLRKVTRRLGPVRELDVLLPLIDELHESRRGGGRALNRIADTVRVARDEAHNEVAGTAAAAELRRVTRKLDSAAKALERADTRPSTRGWQWALEARVARRASALRTAIDEAGAVYLPERLHAVRIALKKLRYGVELWVEATGSKVNTDLRRLKSSQELLGRLHDRHVLITYVRREQAALAPSHNKVWGELDALVTSLENNCRALHARYVRDRAVLIALCDRLTTRSDRVEGARRAG
jgi:CHAD domain-containing protein